MLIFLYGPNSYARAKKLSEIIGVYKSRDKGIFPERFDFEIEGDYERFKNSVLNVSLLRSKRFFILDNTFEITEKKQLKEILLRNTEDKEAIIAVISDTKPPASFAFMLRKPCVYQHFPALAKGAELNDFIKKEAQERGANLELSDIETLAEDLGVDLWRIATELDKLALVGADSIQKKASWDFFKMIMGFKNGRRAEDRVPMLEIILSGRGDDPAKVFNMLSAGYTKNELMNQLADYDVMIKSGKLDYEEALLEIALS